MIRIGSRKRANRPVAYSVTGTAEIQLIDGDIDTLLRQWSIRPAPLKKPSQFGRRNSKFAKQ